MDQITITTENAVSLVNFFLDDMINYIDDEWDDSYAEKMTRGEAEIYLGHSVKGMTREAIYEEISEIQRAYYTEGPASKQEILDQFLFMINQ